ncbi:MAG: hypothetical protein J6Y71_01145 [Ruminococcus sp.]|nr:hypothetical protein [Ruminococcus sp.]
MATKYEEAAFLNDNDAFETLTLDEAINCISTDQNSYYQRYDGRLYCPECHTPHIGIVNRDGNYFFRAYPGSEHTPTCFYGFEPISSNTFQEYVLREENHDELNGKLQRFVYRLLNRGNIDLHNLLLHVQNDRCTSNNTNLVNIRNRREIRRIPTKSISAPFNNDDLNCYMLFYGKVDVRYSIKGSGANAFHKIYCYKRDRNELLCSLSFSRNVAVHLENNYNLIPDEKKSNMCVAFYSEMKRNGQFLNARLTHSKLFFMDSQ